MIKTPQKLPDVTDAGFHNPTIEVNWFYSDFVLQSIIKIVGTVLGMAGGWYDHSKQSEKSSVLYVR